MPPRTAETEGRDRRNALIGVAVVLVVLPVAALLPSCGGQTTAAPVDPGRAREALHTVLECWQKGDPIDALKSASPAIVAQDFDWMSGLRLLAFEITGDGQDDNANLRIPVQLTLRSPKGKELTKRVTYVVGTSPALTVFRDFP